MANHYRKKTSAKYIFRRVLVLVLAAAVIIGAVLLLKSCFSGDTPDKKATQSTVSQEAKPPVVVSTVSIGSTGDTLLHNPVLDGAKVSGGYDFSADYKYINPYYSKYDSTVVNLEVTFGTSTNYQGFPLFNAPPVFADTLKNAGVDLLLTANNHSYDTVSTGLINTVKVLKEKGIDHIGTREDETEPLYGIRTVGGIKIATACYTYSTTPSPGRKALNGNVMKEGTENLISTFDYEKLDEFYTDAENALKDMKNSGAEFSVIYMHWGNEYQLKQNSYQSEMAQKLCDMGWDIIIGSHPHVVQPIETLKSASGHETVCIYSMGNSISNQRREVMDSSVAKKGYTEDGLIFEYTLQKYSDGAVKLSDINVLPTWVNHFKTGGKGTYRIVALDTSVSDWSSLGVTRMRDAKASYERTMGIVGEGLNAYRTSHGLSEVKLTVE